jgi:hypothetical protein
MTPLIRVLIVTWYKMRLAWIERAIERPFNERTSLAIDRAYNALVRAREGA